MRTLQILSAVLLATLTASADAPSARRAEPAKSGAVRVDCDRGKKIAEALEKPADELVIEITGTCREDLVIRRDRVSLVGAGADPALVGSLFLDGASGILLEGFTIRDSETSGVHAHGAHFVARNVVAEDNARAGFNVLNGSTAILEEVTSVRNGSSSPSRKSN